MPDSAYIQVSRSTPLGEEHLCLACARMGYADRWWPCTAEFWPLTRLGTLDFRACRACRADITRLRRPQRKQAA